MLELRQGESRISLDTQARMPSFLSSWIIASGGNEMPFTASVTR
nr:hypothetical protein LKV13_04430 [Borrelia sp. BU AG58]